MNPEDNKKSYSFPVVIMKLLLFTGNYFGTHFIMGGERFDTPQPEAYLFGENSDLNFLGTRPTPVKKRVHCSKTES
jgi:hypothetical protein